MYINFDLNYVSIGQNTSLIVNLEETGTHTVNFVWTDLSVDTCTVDLNSSPLTCDGTIASGAASVDIDASSLPNGGLVSQYLSIHSLK